MPLPYRPATGNLLLNLLSDDDYGLLAPHLAQVPTKVQDVFYHADRPIEHCYFPEGGVASVVALDAREQPTEVGLFGREGTSAVPVLLGSDRSPQESFVQVGTSTALRLPTERLVDALGQSSTMQALLLRFAFVFVTQTARTAQANARYTLAERLARWLLMCHDRVEGDEFAITHEYMAMMLGVRRSGVTLTLHILEGAGAIRSRRGSVTISNRAELEELAGGTYGTPEEEYRRLIGPMGKVSPRVAEVAQDSGSA